MINELFIILDLKKKGISIKEKDVIIINGTKNANSYSTTKNEYFG
jgi:hypothetical protein